MPLRALSLLLLLGLAMGITEKLSLFLGRGYDILYGNPYEKTSLDPGFRSQIFAFDYSNENKTIDGRYLIPDDVGSAVLSTCSLSSTV